MSNRKAMIAGNWKMNLNSKEAGELARAMVKGLKPGLSHDVLLAPSFTNLHAVREALAGSNVILACQDICWENSGAFTGAVSPSQAVDAGCTHAIIGHSERRKIFLETDAVVNSKIKAALKNSLFPVFCIGETLEERESGRTFDVLSSQLKGGLSGIDASDFSRIVVAYEPVWAIGTGKTATPGQAQEAHAFIRKELSRIYDPKSADAARILYGGSVKAENIDELMAQADIDGALVGGESLKADKFLRVIHYQVSAGKK